MSTVVYNSREGVLVMYDFPKKTFIIIRGLPGSGKSTLSHDLARISALRGYSIQIRETDMYFMNDGKYEFDASKLGLYHNQNQIAVLDDMKNDVDWVVLSNTSLTIKEIDSYIRFAASFGYHVEVLTVTGDYGSIHGVPVETMNRMRQKMVPHDKFVEQVNDLLKFYESDVDQ